MKYYFLFFFVFCLLVGGGVYALNPSSISLSFFSYEFSLPLSLWILGSVGIFFIVSLFFFANHWMGKFLFNYRQKKDFDRLVLQIYDQILQKTPIHFSYKTQPFQTLSKILQRVKFEPSFESSPSQNSQIDQLFLNLESLNDGKVIQEHFPTNTPLWIKNTQNKIRSDLKFAQKVLGEDYNASLKQYAILQLIQNETLSEKNIQKIIHQDLDQNHAKEILQHFLDKGYRLGQAELIKFLANFDSKALIVFFNQYKNSFDPDFCVGLFRELAQQKEEARNAYVYVLIDFSMFDRAKEFLRDHEELILPKAYIELKESGRNYPFDVFFA